VSPPSSPTPINTITPKSCSAMASQPPMDMEKTRLFVQQLFLPKSESTETVQLLACLRNAVIGNNKQKTNVIALGVVPRLLQFLLEENGAEVELLTEAAAVLGSLAKGSDENVKTLVEAGVIPVLLNKGLSHPHVPFIESSLRCVRTIFLSPLAPVQLIYQDEGLIRQLITVMPLTPTTQECVANIFARSCKDTANQVALWHHGVVRQLGPMLTSPRPQVQLPALRFIAVIAFQNEGVAATMAATHHEDPQTKDQRSLIQILIQMLRRDKPVEIQLATAKCLTHLCKAGALEPLDPAILYLTLPTLVRMCKRERLPLERIEGANVLSYLIETDVHLQRVAAISDHLIGTLIEYFHPDILQLTSTTLTTMQMPFGSSGMSAFDVSASAILKRDLAAELQAAAFRAYASLGSNDEDIRRKIIEQHPLMNRVVQGLSDPHLDVRLAATRCLHSMSRSVQLLRTTFQDHAVWKPLMKMLHNASDEVLRLASSTLCNLLLEFSPSKEPILESGVIDMLVGLTRRDDPALRVNGIWALMNVAFQAEQKVKLRILNSIGTEQLFHLLNDENPDVVMKTLGMLRNLLTGKSHIDHIMSVYGQQILQFVVVILEGGHQVPIKEQALCLVANIADGNDARAYIMTNEDVLRKIINYMLDTRTKLQIAAVFCVCNLLRTEEEGAIERQAKLREMGIQRLLQQLLTTQDPILFDKVKTALQQFA